VTPRKRSSTQSPSPPPPESSSSRAGYRGPGGCSGLGRKSRKEEEERERNLTTSGEASGVELLGPGAYVEGGVGIGYGMKVGMVWDVADSGDVDREVVLAVCRRVWVCVLEAVMAVLAVGGGGEEANDG
jgi:hypothetical protein